jgi:hypothetical protein
MYAAGVGVSRDASEARRLWQRASELHQGACDAGQAEECFSLAVMYDRARGVSQDIVRSAELYQKACDGGHGKSCLWLGVTQSPLARWADRSFDDFTIMCGQSARASAGRDDAGPVSIARIMVAKQPLPDQARAAELYRRACDGGSAQGCRELASLLEMGHGVPMDRAKALELYERACEGRDALACSAGGTLASASFGAAADARGMRLYTQELRLQKETPARLAKACDAADATACHDLALYGSPGIDPLATAKAGELQMRPRVSRESATWATGRHVGVWGRCTAKVGVESRRT